ncbi:MAG: hypothetical protein WEE66_04495 [Actinomycetota bacterium]
MPARFNARFVIAPLIFNAMRIEVKLITSFTVAIALITGVGTNPLYADDRTAADARR